MEKQGNLRFEIPPPPLLLSVNKLDIYYVKLKGQCFYMYQEMKCNETVLKGYFFNGKALVIVNMNTSSTRVYKGRFLKKHDININTCTRTEIY